MCIINLSLVKIESKKLCIMLFFIVLLRFRSQVYRNPQPATRNEDIEELKKLRDSELSEMSVPLGKVPDQCFQ